MWNKLIKTCFYYIVYGIGFYLLMKVKYVYYKG